MLEISPLAPDRFPDIPPVPGVRIAGCTAGLKQSGRPDLFFAELVEGTTASGVMTLSKCASAPVDWCRAILPRGHARAVVVNSGNANAFTGRRGDTTVACTAASAAKLLGCEAQDVWVASTGVIGLPVAEDHIAAHLPMAAAALNETDWLGAARAIMTTDTFPKGAFRRIGDGADGAVLAGIAKGSGMIAPNLGTMLAFLFTDAAIPAAALQETLVAAVARSFNSITVDSDTSTSDTVLLFATGQAAESTADPAFMDAFRDAVEALCVDLATQIVRDGEGAQKLITIEINGAESDPAARRIGLAIGNSPLVKTAIAGGDPNWGRIVMAVGKAGEKANRDALSISLGDRPVTLRGERVEDYDESTVTAHMAGQEIKIAVDVGIGDGQARIWTCDLTHTYIDINADYRT